MAALIKLMLKMPWWADLAILAVLAALGVWLRFYLSWKFNKIVEEAVLEVGSSLEGAEVAVHGVEAAPPPAAKSPYDIDEDDENFMEGVDDQPWDEEGTDFYRIDVTITPKNPAAAWDPTALALVPVEHGGTNPTEFSARTCPLHSAELFADGGFRPAAEGEVRGPQRVRMLFAVHPGLRAVKFAKFATYFGHVDLPAPLPRQSKPRPHASRT